ncbi:G protein-coupled receptor, putative [Ixodes scapularis]|uniref:G protein-coupled receptor, putative n=1 Tax=Ixodes scapularis TaxID=6945 RepID=B7PYE1_IXOSC|nr:G protein-coupled receptor, putative [Ixodes scapularis]|eukprot:XP_002402997.1 G protein-coupled receptor, putative [Ixodes scapularis]
MEGVIDLALHIANETSSEGSEKANDTSSKVLRFKDYPHDALITGFVFLVLMVVFGVLANTVSILALVKSSKLNNATTALIVNLCFTDLMFSATSTPFAVTVFWNAGWAYSHGLCVAYGVSRFFNVGASIFTVIAITINRYVIIVKPMLYKRVFTPGNNLLVVTGTWLITVALMLATTAGLWGSTYLPEEGVRTAGNKGTGPDNLVDGLFQP